MGCCGPHDQNIDDFPFEKVEEYNNLKCEINELITNKDNKDRKNFNKVLELFNKTSKIITEYEREIKKLKNKKTNSTNFNFEMVQGLNDDIQQLKEYNHALNNLIKECDENDNKFTNININNDIGDNKQIEINENNNDINNFINDDNEYQKEKEIVNDELHFSRSEKDENDEDNVRLLKNNLQNNFENEFQNDFQNEEDIQNENELQNEEEKNNIDNINNNKIYYKKSVRRNKKSLILNKKSKQKGIYPQSDIYNFPIMENNNELKESNQNNDEYNNNINNNNEDENEDEIENDNLINIIFVLENGKNVGIQAERTDKFLDVVEKLGEKEEEYNNIDNIFLFDGDEDITDIAKNGEFISSLGFNDNHFIQVKLASNNN